MRYVVARREEGESERGTETGSAPRPSPETPPPAASSGKKSKSERYTKSEREDHYRAVDLLLKGNADYKQIQRTWKSKTGVTLNLHYIESLADKVRDHWLDAANESKATQKLAQIHRLFGHLRKAEEKANLTAIAKFEEMIARLQGNFEPLRVEAEVVQTTAMKAVFSAMGEAELVAELEAALEEERLATKYRSLLGTGDPRGILSLDATRVADDNAAE